MNVLMEGIEVLNQIEIMQPPRWAVMLLIICLVITFISYALWALAVNSCKDILAFIFAILSLISIIGAMIGLCCVAFIEEPTGQYQYDCLIKEEVLLVDFYEQYEIIEVNGQIWTIKEK